MQTTVITGALLIDGTGRPPVPGATVVVQDGRIAAAGPSGAIAAPAGTAEAPVQVIDASGKAVLPGLLDAHVHLSFSASEDALRDVLADDQATLLGRTIRNAQLALAAGVTLVCDCGAPGGVAIAVRRLIDAGVLVGPRILASGAPVTTTAGHLHFCGLAADTADQARAALRSQVKLGADFIKVMATGGGMTPGTNPRRAQYTAAELTAIVEDAHRLNKRVAAHCHATDGIRNAVEAGVSTIEHCSWLGRDGDTDYDRATVKAMVARGSVISATMAGYRRAQKQESINPSQAKETWVGNWRRWNLYRDMYQAGVKFILSSDSGCSLVPLEDLSYSLEAGQQVFAVSPVEAIAMTTGRVAEVLGLADDLGTVQPGRRADLLIVEGNPAENLADLRRVHLVLKDGRVVVREGNLVLG